MQKCSFKKMSTNLGDEAQCMGGGGQGALSAFS